ncbi:MAG TPA: type II toxin-antitoxin system VapC family toxin [Phycisphaerae bacterium]|nr:type II toxin-antitoxin system VapC family toxin [Phycisphaerae bacterium]HVX84798.1 type II toxin-antitoxin system VapC family toxin [Phycisphaerae bacterium]
MIILDTDVVSLVLGRESEVRERILSRIDMARRSEAVVTTIITYEEQIRGWFKVLSRAKTLRDAIGAYERLSKYVEDYRTLTVVRFNEGAAVAFQRLQGEKLRLGTMDLRIAAIVLANDATLWSRNLRDFERIPGLRVADPGR